MTKRTAWECFKDGDWYGFWTGGSIRNAFFQQASRLIRRLDRWFESLDGK
jgi:hypothetical protein